MSDTERFKNKNGVPTSLANAHKVAPASSLLASNTFKQSLYSIKRLRHDCCDSIRLTSKIINPIKPSSRIDDILANMTGTVSSFAASVNAVNDSIAANKAHMNKLFEPASAKEVAANTALDASVFSYEARMLGELKAIKNETERNAEISSNTSTALIEAAEFNKETLAALIQINEELKALNQLNADSALQAKSWNDNNTKFSKSESRKSWFNLLLVAATFVATVYSIFH